MRYDLLIEEALRNVVRQAMTKVARDGLLGDHHFYISFLTTAEGVEVPDYLRGQYPEEMTIVLQHQFFGLKADETGFSVMLSFNNVRERIAIPYAAVTTFADPSVNFALQFRAIQEEGGGDDTPSPSDDSPKGGSGEEKRGEIISLDQFRKK